jgi:hypothetical protein
MDTCSHYWIVPSPETDSKIKTCRVCKEVKDFSSLVVDEFTLPRKPSKHLMYGYKGGRPKGSKKS